MTRRLKLKFDNEEDEVVGKLSSENDFFMSQGNDIKECEYFKRKSTHVHIIFHNFLSQL